ncbi:MAG: YbaB/EbfC family nucleoid-associated protein [Holosporales bacterium]|jgi:DNA-binding YbaB/EbfC family protein|nr:YbaB/EbfC family nucleoid-associated protein [Holosporales bacterium]
MAFKNELFEQMQDLQARLENKEVRGEAGTGLVAVVMNCKGDVKSVKIAKELLADNVEILEDLIVAAMGDAKKKIEVLFGDILSKSGLGM